MSNPPQSQGDLLILSVPTHVDLNLLADAFVTFIEEEMEALGPGVVFNDEPFAWKEVSECQFDEMCAAFLEKAGQGPFLQAVWAEGRLGIVAATDVLAQSDWDRLVGKLTGSQCGPVDPAEWRIIEAPGQPAESAQETTSVAPLPRADRHGPLPASVIQRIVVAVSRQRVGGRHGVVAMRPIVLPMPDAAALEATFQALQARHDILQMSFVSIDGLDHICLSPGMALPFDTIAALRPFRNIDIIAAERTRVLAERPLSDQLLWCAELVQDSSQGIVIAVLSDAIADPCTTDLLRADILRFYEAFCAGLNPQMDWPAPKLQYTDYAAGETGFPEACDWWRALLPELCMTRDQTETAPVAAVEIFEHHLAPEMLEQLQPVAEATGSTVQTLVLAMFLKTLSELEVAPLDWVLVAMHDRRPAGLEEMLGPFAFECPIWLGDMRERITPSGLQLRLNETRAAGAAPLAYLATELPRLVPQRVRHQFDWRDGAVLVRPSESAADVTLSVAQTETAVHLQWAVRVDDPLGATAQLLAQNFLRHLDMAIRVQDFTVQP